MRMGVKGISSMIMKASGPYCSKLTLQQAVADWRAENGKTEEDRPILVIDAMSLVHNVYSPLEHIYQGQWKQFCERMQILTQRLDEWGVQPIFHFDGSVEKSRHRIWVERRTKELSEVEKLFENLDRNPSADVGHGICAAVPTITPFIVKFICNKPVYQSVIENDTQCALMARSLAADKCMGVLSNDTDFLFYDMGKGVHFYLVGPGDNDILKPPDMTVYRCDRDKFCQWLVLHDQSLLPLVGCLMGNDGIPYDQLRDFHLHFGKGNQRFVKTDKLIQAIAAYITAPAAQGYSSQEALIANVQSRILRPQFDLQQAVNVYKAEFDMQEWKAAIAGQAGLDESILQKLVDGHVNCEQTYSILSILSSPTYYGATCHENPIITGLPSVHQLLMPVLERLYGFVLGEGVEKMAYISVAGEKAILSQGTKFVSKHVKCSVKLNDCFEEMCPKSDKVKALIAIWGMQDLTAEMFIELPDNLAIWTVLVKYMKTNIPDLQAFELDALIAMPVLLQDYSTERLHHIHIDAVSVRCVHLLSIVNRAMVMMLRALGVTNYPWSLQAAMPWNLCDGKLFQWIYGQASACAAQGDGSSWKDGDGQYQGIIKQIVNM